MGAELFAVPFACSLILLCMVERVINAVMCLVFRVTPWKQLAAQNVLVRLAELLASVVTVATRTSVQVAIKLLGLWLLFITVFVIFSAVWVTYDEYPEVWLRLVAFYNANLGPFVSFVLTTPLEILDVLLRSFIPLYDAVVWWAKALLVQVMPSFDLYMRLTCLTYVDCVYRGCYRWRYQTSRRYCRSRRQGWT